MIIAIAALYQSLDSQSEPTQPKPPTAEYFDISGWRPQGFIEQNGTELVLHLLTFNLTAVGGSARNVIVHNLGVGEDFPWEPYIELETMLQGEVATVLLNTEKGVHIPLTSNPDKGEVFPVRIRITSEETSSEPQEQFITIYLVESDLYAF